MIPRLRAFSESPEMLALRWALPWSFVGFGAGLALFMALEPSGDLLTRFGGSLRPAFGIMSAVLVVLLSLDLARRRFVPIPAALGVALAAFAFSLPYSRATSFESLANALGSSGLFLAMGIALIAVNLLAALRARLGALYGTLAGAALVIGGAGALCAAGVSLTEMLDIVIAPLGTLGDSLSALLIITLVETLLWSVGIHGPALLAAVLVPVYLQLQAQNTYALSHGEALPHIVTVSTFLFVFPGGAGATFPLVLLLLRSKIKRARTVAYASLVPAIFNANEPLMFGLPLVLNPYLCVPFVFAPLVLAFVTWEAIHLGLVARPAFYVPSSLVPLPINVFLATKDWRSIVLVTLNLLLAAVIYAPFVKLYERHELSIGADE